VELHLGGKSKIEVEPPEKTSEYPDTEKFTAKISSLNPSSGAVQISGIVKGISGLTTFTRSNEADGKVIRITLTDESGQVTAVVWNEKATELETLKINSHLRLINARVKEAQNGGIELHVDSNTYVNVQNAPLKITKIDSLTENQTVSVQGIVGTASGFGLASTGRRAQSLENRRRIVVRKRFGTNGLRGQNRAVNSQRNRSIN